MTQNNDKKNTSCTLCVHIKSDLAKTFKTKCESEGLKRSVVLRDAILAYLDGRLTIVEKQNSNNKPSYFV